MSDEQAPGGPYVVLPGSITEDMPCIVCGKPVEPGTGARAAPPFFPALHAACARGGMREVWAVVGVIPGTSEDCFVALPDPDLDGAPMFLVAAGGPRLGYIIETAKSLLEVGRPVRLLRFTSAEEVPIDRVFACPQCHRVSWNPNDAKQRYCGACKEFFT